jgi:hypothetical protein
MKIRGIIARSCFAIAISNLIISLILPLERAIANPKPIISLILPLERAIAKFNTYAIAHPNSGKGDRNLKPHNVAHPTDGYVKPLRKRERQIYI